MGRYWECVLDEEPRGSFFLAHSWLYCWNMSRLIIISSRLPFSLDKEGDKITLRQSSGGLVSAIKSYFENASAQRGDLTGKMWMGVADFPQEDWAQAMEQQDAGQ